LFFPSDPLSGFEFLGIIDHHIAIAVLAAISSVPAARAKDNADDFTRVYRHSYDEVWDASHEAIERLGWFVTDTDDKDKGAITGKGAGPNGKTTFTLHIESVSPKPETRETIDVKWSGFQGSWGGRKYVAKQLFEETQKVLATYK
jgi:hypothetical protein